MTPDGLPAAGFWRRYAAYAADSLLFGPVVAVALAPYDAWSQAWMDHAIIASADPVSMTAHLQLADMLLGAVLAQAVMALPVALCLASRWRATPGKKLFGLVVVGPDLGRLGFKRALLRELGKIPASLLLGVGILAIGWRADRRAWYDVWAGTRVMKRWPLEAVVRHSPEGVKPDMLVPPRS
ncbi:MAG: serine/threonine protein kinase [Cyanobacteria bacterium RYN_339]|nr:serine/threonine protein kinase [Cyanobacteria bacterium RYN_339]